jgi:hypothetical protein
MLDSTLIKQPTREWQTNAQLQLVATVIATFTSCSVVAIDAPGVPPKGVKEISGTQAVPRKSATRASATPHALLLRCVLGFRPERHLDKAYNSLAQTLASSGVRRGRE